ncbi:MAG: polar localization protein TipN [Phenylobacterium sp.]|uniref:polar localization protein TipN n=1 Tax=Phenylobacterium sp. TaxID=1871053 RepID=UPI001A4C6B78|nr:polar localization protein TipN [Phenylobacterium sp.]MBL8554537.1 polar localization protein TipN [Phenylobacterium sp.]
MFSKRQKPADFGSSQALDAAGPAAPDDGVDLPLTEAVGFRPIDRESEQAVTAPSARAAALRRESEAAAQGYVARLEAAAPAPAGWPIWLTAVAVAGLWALAPIAFAVGYRSNVAPLQNDAFALAVFALLAIGPAAFVFGAAYMIRQGQKLSWEARRAKAAAEDMLAPALVSAARAGDVAQAVRDEIARAGQAAEEARETMLAMRDALAFETDKLTGVTAQSVRTAQELAATLGRERSEMGQLAQTLDAQSTRITDAIVEQAKMVGEAAGVADAQIREAETALAARAADLAAAAGDASSAARVAGEDLTRHIARLETAGTGVADQVKAVETGLSEQRAALVGLSQALKGDHQAFAAEAEAHAAKLGEFIETTRISAGEMAERATAGGEHLRRLMGDAALQFRDLAETAKAEREEFGQSTLQSLEAVSAAAAEQRAHLEAMTRTAIDGLATAAEETREAAARHAAAAREQVDHLSEAAFAAGQKANQAFEARLEEAKALIEQSSKMVEDAGATTAKRLADGAAAARETLDELAAMLAELEARASQLPVAAAGQARQVRAAVADGMDELMAQARRTAEEAQAIDAAFQERVRRNFEMLSEAVRLMGVAAVSPPPPAALASAPAPAPAAAPPPPARKARAVTAPPPEEEPLELSEPADPTEPPGALADRLGLKSRLRFTPTATDREFSAVFQAAAGLPATQTDADADDGEDSSGDDTWTWKDLLASLDGADGEGERLEETLAAELARMGVDPEKLLPLARIEEIAAAVQTGDVEGAREVVKKLAPAATRRIARRLFTDEDIKRKTEVYVRRYKTLADDAVARDPAGFVLANMLAAEAGRLFLLLDAAGGDMI